MNVWVKMTTEELASYITGRAEVARFKAWQRSQREDTPFDMGADYAPEVIVEQEGALENRAIDNYRKKERDLQWLCKRCSTYTYADCKFCGTCGAPATFGGSHGSI